MEDNQKHFGNQNQIISEKDVRDYVMQRFHDVKQSNKIKNLVKFQTMNKYMVMAHDQVELKNLGNIVASYKKISFSDILQEYDDHLRIAMIKEPTIKTHTNVIMHIFGHFSKNLHQNEKQLIFELIEQFIERKITVGKILLEMNPIICRFNNTYLASQTYFLLYSDVANRILFQALHKDITGEFNS